jgi:mycothiol synthase
MRLRSPTVDDAPVVCALIARRDAVDFGITGAAERTVEDMLHGWQAPGFTLATDAVLAEHGDEPVGYGVVSDRGSFAIVVPEHEGQGVGTALLAWVEQREREVGRPVHRQWYAGSNEPARALLAAAGYAFVRSYVRMGVSLNQLDGVPVLPAGFTLRAPDPDRDAFALHALDDTSFAAIPDYQPEPLEVFRSQHLLNPEFDPALSRVAVRDGRIAGFLIASRMANGETGHVDILAVGPEHQRRGIGRALLLDAFARFAVAGLLDAELVVASDNPRARALYEQVGMRPRFRRDAVERSMH